jgi:hypothetical protein
VFDNHIVQVTFVSLNRQSNGRTTALLRLRNVSSDDLAVYVDEAHLLDNKGGYWIWARTDGMGISPTLSSVVVPQVENTFAISFLPNTDTDATRFNVVFNVHTRTRQAREYSARAVIERCVSNRKTWLPVLACGHETSGQCGGVGAAAAGDPAAGGRTVAVGGGADGGRGGERGLAVARDISS